MNILLKIKTVLENDKSDEVDNSCNKKDYRKMSNPLLPLRYKQRGFGIPIPIKTE